jgi:hypothetical protein
VRVIAARQGTPRRPDPVGTDPLRPKEWHEQPLVGHQEIENGREEIGIAGACADVRRAEAGGGKEGARGSGVGREVAEREEREGFGVISVHKGFSPTVPALA